MGPNAVAGQVMSDKTEARSARLCPESSQTVETNRSGCVDRDDHDYCQ